MQGLRAVVQPVQPFRAHLVWVLQRDLLISAVAAQLARVMPSFCGAWRAAKAVRWAAR
jgi:hypothetical protein